MPYKDKTINKQYKKNWYLKNRENILKYSRNYYLLNIEKIRKYLSLNSDKIKKQQRLRNIKSYKINKEKIKINVNNWQNSKIGRLYLKARYHNRRTMESSLTKEIVQQVYEENIKKFGTLTCELCFTPVKFGEDSLEHFTPLSRGGGNERSNLGVAHGNNSDEKCNTVKGTKTFDQWINVFEPSEG